jgi:hypothetical protein
MSHLGDSMFASLPEQSDALPEAWLAHMRRGEYGAAWSVSDRILSARGDAPTWHLPRHLQPVWKGEPLDKRRVLVRCYHGLGDTLQFIRYAPLVSKIAAELMVWAQPELLSLLATVKGIDRLLPLHDGAPGVAYDVDVELMELPHVFRTTLESVPNEVPYLHVPPLFPRADGFAVGIAWAAGDWDARRSVPCELLEALGNVPGVSLHVLQCGPHRAEWRRGIDALARERDAYEQAQFMRSLDLVISVDSMPVHLAGALGVPVWTLLHHAPDWRWMSWGERTAWYPTMRLFRQPRPGDWETVLARVASELARAVRTAPKHPRTHPHSPSLHRASWSNR